MNRHIFFKVLAALGFARKGIDSVDAAPVFTDEPILSDRRIPVMKIGRWYHTPEGLLLSIEGKPYVHWSEMVSAPDGSFKIDGHISNLNTAVNAPLFVTPLSELRADRDIGGMLRPEILEKNDGRPAPVYDSETGEVISPTSLRPDATDPNQAEYKRQWAETEARYQRMWPI